MGDIHAMVGAREMSSGLRNLSAEYGQDGLGAIAAEIIGRSEVAMRRAVSEIPDGMYRSITPIDSFDADHPLEIHCTMEVRGDSLAVDFTGSSLQNESPLNSVLGYTSAYSIYAPVPAFCCPTYRTTRAIHSPSTLQRLKAAS